MYKAKSKIVSGDFKLAVGDGICAQTKSFINQNICSFATLNRHNFIHQLRINIINKTKSTSILIPALLSCCFLLLLFFDALLIPYLLMVFRNTFLILFPKNVCLNIINKYDVMIRS
jgi:hypothetical protein